MKIFYIQAVVAGVDTETLKHADQALPGERCAAQVVPGAVEPDHQAVSDQEVIAHAFEGRDVLDPGLSLTLARPGGGQQQQENWHRKAERGDEPAKGERTRISRKRHISILGHETTFQNRLCETRASWADSVTICNNGIICYVARTFGLLTLPRAGPYQRRGQ